ncbi:Metallo-dependent phosphatase-like protein [Xylariales sp. AK1849]|nr:Metallo-dependent phosphatase-like protein [Xylariales sp. AK1849]
MVIVCPTPHLHPRSRRRRTLYAVAIFFILGTLYLCYTRFDGMAQKARSILPLKSPFDSGATTDNSNINLLPAQDQDDVLKDQISITPMSYGPYARPPLHGLLPISSLPAEKLPTTSPSSPRLIIVGDVHGQLRELEAILKEAGYSSSRGDHVIFTGDLIAKGPDSAGVVALAMEMNASGVRGNHEDRILLAYENINAKHVIAPGLGSMSDLKGTANEDDDLTEPTLLQGDQSKELSVARELTAAQRSWLSKLPVILKLGTVPNYGDMVVVHGGLAPDVPLENQDPWAVMNMRGLLYPAETLRRAQIKKILENKASAKARRHVTVPDSEVDKEMEASHARGEGSGDRDVALPTQGRDGRSWSEAWNESQERKGKTERMTVVYGHDAKRGLNVQKYTFGLDSSCVKGGKLSALVFEPVDDGTVGHRIVSVDCLEARGLEKDDDQKRRKRDGI